MVYNHNMGNNLENPAYLEAMGLSKIWLAYANNAVTENIEEIGFNKNSGYVYIALDIGITIGSQLGNDVEFITFDPTDGNENFYETYDEALNEQYQRWAK